MRVKAFANVYRGVNGAMGSVYLTRELADQMAARDRLACVEFEFEWDRGEVVGGLAAALRKHDGVEQP